MAFTFSTNLGTAQNKTANQASTTLTTTAAAAAGTFAVLIVAVDNNSTTDVDENAVTSVTDSVGNTWQKGAEYTNGQAGAQAGATCSIWFSNISINLPISGVITVNFSNSTSRDASALSAACWTKSGVGFLRGSAVLAGDAVDPAALDYTSPNSEHLRVRGIAQETSATTALTVTASWTAFGGNQTAGSTAATNIGVRGEHRIVTGTSASSNPTCVAIDHVSVYCAFYEQTSTTFIKTVGLQAQLAKVYNRSAFVDARLLKQAITNNISIQAQIQKSGIIKSTGIQAQLAKSFLRTLNADAKLMKVGIQKQLSASAVLKKTVYSYTSLDSKLAASYVKTILLDAKLAKKLTKIISTDARLQKVLNKVVSIEAQIKKVGVIKSIGTDSRLQKSGVIKSVSIDSKVAAKYLKSIGADARLQKNLTKSAGLQAQLAYRHQKTLGTDARIKKTALVKLAHFDAILVIASATLVSMQFDAKLKKLGMTLNTGINAMLASVNLLHPVMSAQLSKTSNRNIGINAAIKKTISSQLAFDATLEQLSYVFWRNVNIDAKLQKGNVTLITSISAIIHSAAGVMDHYISMSIKGIENTIQLAAVGTDVIVTGIEQSFNNYSIGGVCMVKSVLQDVGVEDNENNIGVKYVSD